MRDLPPSEVRWLDTSARRHLGATCTAAVLDLRGGLHADLLGQAHGLVRGGGALILCLPSATSPPPPTPSLAVWPHVPTEVGTRLWRRLTAHLAEVASSPERLVPLEPLTPDLTEQDALVATLATRWSTPDPTATVLLADRGRGKSATLGRAVRRLLDARPDARIALAAPSSDAGTTLRSFAGDLPVLPPDRLLHAAPLDLLVLDEAAQVPVPLLRRLLCVHPHSHLAFATTTRGYEGTGRGFVLRFLDSLAARATNRPVHRHTLTRPVRWAPHDPVEAFVHRVLALDARPSPLPAAPGPVRHLRLDRDALADDESLLHGVFGLLVHAHYRTTPGDLHRLLDAPNLDVHVLLDEHAVVAATLVAHEGGLPPERVARLASGAERIRGHALADTLISHATAPEAGTWPLLRSVRTAVHPGRRREGLGRRLVESVHAAWHDRVALFGTVFSASPEVVGWRRRQGYRVVRVGTSRSARSGEPGVVMVRPVRPEAVALVHRLRQDLARELPGQLDLLEADGGLPLGERLRACLLADLPPATPCTPEVRDRLVRAWALGPRPLDTTRSAVRAWLEDGGCVEQDRVQAMLEARVVGGLAWREVAELGGMPTVKAAMRAVRRGVAGALSRPGCADPRR